MANARPLALSAGLYKLVTVLAVIAWHHPVHCSCAARTSASSTSSSASSLLRWCSGLQSRTAVLKAPDRRAHRQAPSCNCSGGKGSRRTRLNLIDNECGRFAPAAFEFYHVNKVSIGNGRKPEFRAAEE